MSNMIDSEFPWVREPLIDPTAGSVLEAPKAQESMDEEAGFTPVSFRFQMEWG